MKRVLCTAALSALVLAGAASAGHAADPAYNPYYPQGGGPAAVDDGTVPSWRSPSGWTRDHSADDLNRAALPRAIGVPVYGGSGVTPPASNYPYPGLDRPAETTTTTTTTTIRRY